MRCQPQVFAFVSAPVDTPPALGSLGKNQLCGVNIRGEGTYTTEGITKLCEGLKGSAVTSLGCAATTKCSVFAFLSAGADTKVNTLKQVRVPRSLLQRLQRGVALETLDESGSSFGTELVPGKVKHPERA